MKTKEILYLILIMLIPLQTNGMKRPQRNERIFTELIKKRKVYDYSPHAAILSKIEYQIYGDNNPELLAELLSQPQARNINYEDRNNLYAEIEALEKLIIINPNDDTYKHLITKKNYLYAFKMFPQFTFPQAFFNPQPYNRLIDKRPNLSQIIEALIKNEQEKIYICCYHLTLKSLANALIDQKNKGISIEILTNQSQGNNSNDWWVLTNVEENDIPILSPQNDKYEQMHHKFFIFNKNIFNKKLIVIGSYNPTPNGDARSWDDIIILDDEKIIQQYLDRFEEVKNRSKQPKLSSR